MTTSGDGPDASRPLADREASGTEGDEGGERRGKDFIRAIIASDLAEGRHERIVNSWIMSTAILGPSYRSIFLI